jgi:hypothetical protein
MTRSTSPGAQAMRTLRALRRVAAGKPQDTLAERIAEGAYLYRVSSRQPGHRGSRERWEGRVQVNGRVLVIARSATKYGEREAYRLVAHQVGEWLLEVYPPELVAAKMARLLDQAPADLP